MGVRMGIKKRLEVGFGLVLLLWIVALASCTAKPDASTSTNEGKEKKEIIIPVIYLMNATSGIKSNKELVDEFNKAYEGIYHVEVDWLVGDESDYRAKIKLLNATDQLPAIITDVGFSPDFYQLLLENKRMVDIQPYLEKDAEWNETFVDYIIDACREEDGSLYLIPLNSPEYLAGIFYNNEMFQKAGITEFPKTWEDFFKACQKLKESGVTPLSLHTTGTAWAPMLISTAYLGLTEEGIAFMNQQYPDNYDVDVFKKMMTVCKELFQFTTDDAIDGDFEDAATHFYREETAMIANGHWMIDSFYNESVVKKDFASKIGFAPFPSQIFVGSPQMSAWVISSSYPQEVIEGAIAFMRFRTMRGVEYVSQEYIKSKNQPLLEEFYEKVAKAETIVPNYQLKWNSIIQNDVFLEDLPKFIRKEESAEEFIGKMNLAVETYDQEKNN